LDGRPDRLSPSPGLVLGAVLLLLALLRWPYGYYVFMRWVVTAASVYGAWIAYADRRHVWTWILGAVALLFNPILPIHMRREDWVVFDLIGAGLLFAAALLLRTTARKAE